MAEVAAFVDLLRSTAIVVVGTGLLAALVGLLTAASYRWVTTRAPPAGVVTVVGLSTVAGYLSYRQVGSRAFFEGVPLDHQFSAGFVLATVLVGGTVAATGGRLGDRIACEVAEIPRIDADGEAAASVRSGRLAVAIELPDVIDDTDGYQPVDPALCRAIAGATVRLPHGLTAEQRRERLERHLECEYGLGYAAVTLADDGSIERVLVGQQSSGLGSMLPPGTAAVAIRADCAPDASLGDPIEIWSTGDRTRLVATGRLRTTADSVATVVVDRDRVSDLASDERYRVVTRPDEPTDGYEFASTLRTVDETVVTLTVDPEGPLAGEFVGWLPGRVLLVDRDGELHSLPADNETLQADDELWVLGPADDLTDVDPTTKST